MYQRAAIVGILLAAGVAFTLTAKADDANQPPAVFVEVPGEMEFSGEMTARPLQLADLLAKGMHPADAQRRVELAVGSLDGYRVRRYYPETDEYIITIPNGSSEDLVHLELMSTGAFEYVEPNWTVFTLVAPNDPLINQQWHHNANRMNSFGAWEIFTGEPNVTVAICDTGIQPDHPDLMLHRREGFNSVTGLWESQGGQVGPTGNHGTLVVGCAAANGDNAVGVVGVGWNLGYRPVRVSENGSSASLDALTSGAREAVLTGGDRVANVSFSGVGASSVRVTGTVIKNAGGLLVWSAGNNGADLNWGNRDNDDVIVVGATDSADRLASFSAFGRSVDLVAPGVGVFTTTTGSTYASPNGTSFSAPLVAGLIGLVWSYNPDLTPDEVEQIIKLSADDLGAPGVDDTFGYGRINAANALAMTPAPSVQFQFPAGLPDIIDPSGGTTFRVEVIGSDITPVPGTGTLTYNDGSGPITVPMQEIEPNVYDAVFSALECDTQVSFFVSVQTSDGGTANEPRQNIPGAGFAATAVSDFTLVYEEDFGAGPAGWTVGAPDDDATTGIWEWGTPIGTTVGSNQVMPNSCPVGNRCFFTGQHTPGQGAGFNDVDFGKTTLFSPVFDLSGADRYLVSYWRWYSNSAGANPNNDIFVVDVTTDAGQTWTNVETVGPAGAGTSGGWIFHEFRLDDLVTPSDSVQFRFVASDYDPQALVEAAIDALTISSVDCFAPCAADLNGDGVADADDFFLFLQLFADGDPIADINADGVIDADDFFAYLALFAAGC